jgi:hypothetical protein
MSDTDAGLAEASEETVVLLVSFTLLDTSTSGKPLLRIVSDEEDSVCCAVA